MNDQSTSTVTTFLKSIRRELWKRRLADETVRALWWLALCSLILGCTHRWITGVDLRLAALVGGLPALFLVSAKLINGRPGLAVCARSADQWFKGNDVMVSAWEVMQARFACNSWARDIVMSRAQESAEKWRDLLPRHQDKLRQRFVFPISVALAGCFLLISPGTGSIGAVAIPSNEGDVPQSTQSRTEKTESPDDLPAEVLTRNAIQSTPEVSPARADSAGNPGTGEVRAPSMNAENTTSREDDDLSAQSSPASAVTRASGQGVSDQPRGDSDGGSAAPAPEMKIRYINLPKPADDAAVAPDSTRAALLDESVAPDSALAPATTRDTEAGPDTRQINHFSPALNSYVANYMSERARHNGTGINKVEQK